MKLVKIMIFESNGPIAKLSKKQDNRRKTKKELKFSFKICSTKGFNNEY